VLIRVNTRYTDSAKHRLIIADTQYSEKIDFGIHPYNWKGAPI